MKKAFTILLTTLMVACHSHENEAVPSEGVATIGFNVINYEQVSLDGEITRANLEELDHLDMAVYRGGAYEQVDCQQIGKDDAGYGSFSTTLPYGDYTIVFLGYSGTRKANLDSPLYIYFADNYVPQFFYKVISLKVTEENATQNISLQRAVAAFTIVSNGGIPEDLSKMKFAAKGGGYLFNAITGYAREKGEREYTFDVSTVAGNESMSVTFLTFLTSNEATMDYEVTAYDKEGNVLNARSFTNVPMKINQRTRYTGQFFKSEVSAQGFSISLGEDMTNDEHTY